MAKEEEGRRRRRIREVILILILIKFQQSTWLPSITRSFLRIHQFGEGAHFGTGHFCLLLLDSRIWRPALREVEDDQGGRGHVGEKQTDSSGKSVRCLILGQTGGERVDIEARAQQLDLANMLSQ